MHSWSSVSEANSTTGRLLHANIRSSAMAARRTDRRRQKQNPFS